MPIANDNHRLPYDLAVLLAASVDPDKELVRIPAIARCQYEARLAGYTVGQLESEYRSRPDGKEFIESLFGPDTEQVQEFEQLFVAREVMDHWMDCVANECLDSPNPELSAQLEHVGDELRGLLAAMGKTDGMENKAVQVMTRRIADRINDTVMRSPFRPSVGPSL